MELSEYKTRIELEEAIEEFDVATSTFALNQSIDAIHNVVNTNRRWADALQHRYDLHQDIDSELVDRYVRDVGSCVKILSGFHKEDNGRDYSTWMSIMNLSFDKSRDLIKKMRSYD
jgi:hypothetical protein